MNKQYINKDNVIAEIDRLQNTIKATAINGRISKEQAEAYKVCVKLRSFVEDAIKAKEVDLTKEIKNRIDSLCHLYSYMENLFNGDEEEGVYPIPEKVTNELFEFAQYFYELGLKQK